MNLNICYLKLEFTPPFVGGGNRMLYNSLSHLTKLGVNVYVVTNSVERNAKEFEDINGIKIHRVMINGDVKKITNAIIFFVKAYFKIANLKKQSNFEIIHVYSAFSFMGLYTLLLSKLLRCKSCFTFQSHPISFQDLKHLKKKAYFSAVIPSLLWVSKLDKVIVVSRYSYNILKKKKPFLKNVEIVTPSIDLSIYDSLLSSQKEKKEANRIVFASSCNPHKGIEDFVNALYLIKQKGYDFTVIFLFGKLLYKNKEWFEASYFDYIDRKVKNLNLEKNIIFITEPRHDVYDIIASSDILVTPFRSMVGILDIPMSLLEGMACGLTLIGTNIGGVPEVIHDSVNGFIVEPYNVEQLAERIIEVLENEELKKKFREKNLMLVKDFDAKKNAQQIIEIYRRILKLK